MGEGQPLLIVHGLFGMSDNWQSLGKKFADFFEVHLIDQRNHGRSPHSTVFNYEALADRRLKFETKWNFFNYIRTSIAISVSVLLLILLTIR